MINLLISAIMQVLLFLLIPFIWWLITNRKENFFSWLGFRKIKLEKSLAKVIILMIFVAVVYTLFMGLVMNIFLKDVETATSQFAGKGIVAIPSILVYAVIQTSLSEEILFRGFLCKRLSNKFGFVAGNSIQALCFGLLHGVPFFILSHNALVLILLTILPALIGFFQGYVNEKLANGSIFPSWIMHAIMNVFSGIASCL